MDQASAKRVHLNVPKVGHHLAIPAAGRASNMPVEGAAMDWYERVRGQEGINTIILLSNSVVNSDVSLEGLTREEVWQ